MIGATSGVFAVYLADQKQEDENKQEKQDESEEKQEEDSDEEDIEEDGDEEEGENDENEDSDDGENEEENGDDSDSDEDIDDEEDENGSSTALAPKFDTVIDSMMALNSYHLEVDASESGMLLNLSYYYQKPDKERYIMETSGYYYEEIIIGNDIYSRESINGEWERTTSSSTENIIDSLLAEIENGKMIISYSHEEDDNWVYLIEEESSDGEIWVDSDSGYIYKIVVTDEGILVGEIFFSDYNDPSINITAPI